MYRNSLQFAHTRSRLIFFLDGRVVIHPTVGVRIVLVVILKLKDSKICTSWLAAMCVSHRVREPDELQIFLS